MDFAHKAPGCHATRLYNMTLTKRCSTWNISRTSGSYIGQELACLWGACLLPWPPYNCTYCKWPYQATLAMAQRPGSGPVSLKVNRCPARASIRKGWRRGVTSVRA